MQRHDNALGGDRDAHVVGRRALRRPGLRHRDGADAGAAARGGADLRLERAVHDRGHAPRGLGVGHRRELGLGVLGATGRWRRCRRPPGSGPCCGSSGCRPGAGCSATSLLGTPMHAASCAAPGKSPLPLSVLGDDVQPRGMSESTTSAFLACAFWLRCVAAATDPGARPRRAGRWLRPPPGPGTGPTTAPTVPACVAPRRPSTPPSSIPLTMVAPSSSPARSLLVGRSGPRGDLQSPTHAPPQCPTRPTPPLASPGTARYRWHSQPESANDVPRRPVQDRSCTPSMTGSSSVPASPRRPPPLAWSSPTPPRRSPSRARCWPSARAAAPRTPVS